MPVRKQRAETHSERSREKETSSNCLICYFFFFFVVACVDALDDNDLNDYLPQFAEVLKYEVRTKNTK